MTIKLQPHHNAPAAISTTEFHLSAHPRLKDSVSVQTSEKHNYVNDYEAHEEQPHLEDFLMPHHTVHLHVVAKTTSETEATAEDDGIITYLDSIPCPHETLQVDPRKSSSLHDAPQKEKQLPSLPRPKRSCLRKPDCLTRKPCTKTEARRTIQFKDIRLREYGKFPSVPCVIYSVLYSNRTRALFCPFCPTTNRHDFR